MGCFFLAQVKRNRRKLWEIIALDTALSNPISTFEQSETKGGRRVTRSVELYENQSVLPKGWNNIERFVKVRRWGYREGKDFEELTFFILSKPLNHASVVAQAIQSHWSIENELHWVKDVNMGEDASSIKTKNSAMILSHFNSLALNILRANGYKPSKNTFAKFANKVNELSKLLFLK